MYIQKFNKMKAELTITDVRFKKNGELNPVVVEFQNGDIIEQKGPGLQAKLHSHEQPSDKIIEVSTPDGQKYVNNPINISPFSNKFIAIRNRKTNKVKLVEVEFTTLINSLYVKEKEQTGEDATEDAKDVKQQTATLKKMFGTKKAVRLWAQKESLDLENSHVEDQISEMLTGAQVSETTIDNTESESSLMSLTPPCDRNAKELSDVYKIEDCISEAEINSLMEVIMEILGNKFNLEDCSEYLKENLINALTIEENRKARIACLLYADSLIGYLKVQAKAIMKMMPKISPHSKLIRDKIIGQFCTKAGSALNRPVAMKDKAMCHIIVLTLLACNYTVDLVSLSKQSAFGFAKMKQLGRIVGVVQSNRGSDIFVLKVPLPALPSAAKPVRKKK